MRLHAAAGVLLCLSSTAAPGPQSAAAPPVFPARADLVRLDLVVRDKAGRLVNDLRADEVQVLEDGKPCAIGWFRLVQSDAPRRVGGRVAVSDAATRPDERAEAEGDRLVSVVVLVFDQLGPEPARNARAAALDLAGRTFPPGSVFAVFKIGQGLAVLQSFTENRTLLPAAIEMATSGVDQARDPARRRGYDNTTEEAFAVARQAREAKGVDAMFLAMEARMLLFSDRETRQSQGQGSLQPLVAIANGLSLVQGRKSLLYFSEGVAVPPTVEDLFQTTVSTANRANVSVYSFDARGLRVRSPFEETRDALEEARANAMGEQMGGAEAREGIRASETASDAMRLNRQGVLRALAESTGGFLVGETNDLRSGVERVTSDLRAYYEVGYLPPSPKADGRWRAITVKVSRPGVVVRTRRGYYALPPGALVVQPYELPLAEALAASPTPHDLEHRAATLRFAGAGPATDVVVWVEVPLAALALARDETSYRGHVSLLVAVKDEKGTLVARMSHDAPLEGPLADADTARERTAVVKRTLRLPPGRYVLETAVQDRESGKVGARRTSFEVPEPAAGLSLGSVAIVRADDAGTAASDESDPLRTSRVRATPLLGRSFREGTPIVSVLASLHPAAGADPVSAEIEIRRDGQPVARATPELPPSDPGGRITYVGSLPTAALRAGLYEVWVRGKQGEVEAAEATAFTIAARASAAGAETAAGAPAPSLSAVATAPGSIEDRPGVATPLATILERAGRYVLEYEETFRNLVAEERYRQWGLSDTTGGKTARTLRSDLVFVRLPGPLPWGTFRDVYEVDGQKVRDRGRRLEKLFLSPGTSDLEQAQAILDESSRFNLGRAYRNVNVPALGLLFLRPDNQPRLAFKRKGTRSIAGFPTVEVAFQERKRPSLVHDRFGNDVPASGKFWIDETRGTVLRTEIEYDLETEKGTRSPDAWERGVIATEYRREIALACVVPDTMTELYDFRAIGRVDAVARYSNYRRFDVSVGTAAVLPLTFGREAADAGVASASFAPPPVAAPAAAEPTPAPPPAEPEPLVMVAAPELPGAIGGLLQKAGEYVVRYEQAFRNVVAVEESTQVLEQPAATPGGRRVAGPPGGITRTTRRLRSEVAFVMLPGPIPWTAFRDVVEVDGLCVAEGRPGRLEQMLKRSPSAIAGEAEGVDREGRQYALGPKGGTTSVLTMTLGYLHPDVRDRFAFERKHAAKAPGQVELAFAETTRPPLAHATAGGDIPARGTVVLREADGAILRTTTEFRSEVSGRILRVTTDYRLDPDLALLVPAEMQEVYETIVDADQWPGLPDSSRPTPAGDRLETTARYAAFRRVP